MKKQLFFALLAMTFGANVFAQISRTQVPLSNKAARQSRQHYLRQRAASKGTAVVPRCIALVEYARDTTAYLTEDSTTYSYPGMRPGTAGIFDLEQPLFKYDSGNYYYNDLTGGPFPNVSKLYQTFDGSDNILSTLIKHITTGAVWINQEQELYTYDGANNMLSQTTQEWDSAGAAWVNDSRTLYTYTGTNNMATNTYQTWDAPTSAWVNTFNSTYNYDGMDRELTEIDREWNTSTGSWDNQMLDTLIYDGSSNCITIYYTLWDPSTSAWEANYYNEDMNSDFIDHVPQTTVSEYWDVTSSSFTLINADRSTFIFNPDNQLTYFFDQKWSQPIGDWNPVPEFGNRYYYEGYTAVSNIAQSSSVTVCPNPNNGNFTVNVPTDNQPVKITVTNIIGETLREVSATTSQPIDIDLNEPAGIYFVTVTTASSKSVHKVIVSK